MNANTLEILIWSAAFSVLSLGAAWVITATWKKLSAGWQHFVWLLALTAPLVALVLSATNLRIDLPLLAAPPAPVASSPMKSLAESGEATLSAEPAKARFAHLPTVFWMAGALAWLACLAASHLRMRYLLRRVTLLDPDHPLRQIASETWGKNGGPRLAVGEVKAPFCYGFLNPVIVFPKTALPWNAEKFQACLRHEHAHLQRGDLWTTALAHLACAAFWFNPLVWMAARRLRTLSEIAADDLVIQEKTAPAAFAAYLLEVVTEARGARLPLLALSMARPTHLKLRLKSILDDQAIRRAPRRRSLVGASVLLLVATTIITSVRLVSAESPDAKSDNPKTEDMALMNRKLDEIIIPKVDFHDVTIPQALDFLKQRSVALDTTGSDPKGINIVLKVPPDSMEAGAIITLALNDVPLRTVIDYLAKACGLKMKIESSQVVIVPEADGNNHDQPQGKTEGMALMNRKLDEIIIPSFVLKETTTSEAIAILKQRSVDLDTTESDPARKGINIVLEVPPEYPDVNIRSDSVYNKLSLREAINSVARGADLTAKIESSRVVLVPLDSTTLLTVQYDATPQLITFFPALFAASGQSNVQDFLASKGVSFPPGASANFDPTSHKLIFTNTPANHKLVKDLIVTLTPRPKAK